MVLMPPSTMPRVAASFSSSPTASTRVDTKNQGEATVLFSGTPLSSSASSSPDHEEGTPVPTHALTCLTTFSFLFSPFLGPKDCLTMAGLQKSLAHFRQCVSTLKVGAPYAQHHYNGLRRLVRHLPHLGNLKVRPHAGHIPAPTQGLRTSPLPQPFAGRSLSSSPPPSPLPHAPIGYSMVRVVSGMLADGLLRRLVSLDLSNVSLRPVGARSLAMGLASGGCHHLKTLDLSFTDIGDAGVTYVAKALYNGRLLGSPLSVHPLSLPPGCLEAAARETSTAAFSVDDIDLPLYSLAVAAATAATAGAATEGMALPPPLPPSLPPSLPPHHAAACHSASSPPPPASACPLLESLILTACGVGDTGMIALADYLPAACPFLNHLALCKTAVSPVGWTRGVAVLLGPEGFPLMRKFQLPRAGSAGGLALRTVAQALSAGGSPLLEELFCGSLCITDGGVSQLAAAFRQGKHRQLRHLYLPGGCVGPAGLADILSEIRQASYPEAGGEEGREGGLCGLTHLALSAATLTGGRMTMATLIDFVRRGGGGSLQYLDLSWHVLGEGVGEGLREALDEGRCGKLRELHLSANALPPFTVLSLLSSLVLRRVCPSLELLLLDSNALKPRDVYRAVALLHHAHTPGPRIRVCLRGMGFGPHVVLSDPPPSLPPFFLPPVPMAPRTSPAVAVGGELVGEGGREGTGAMETYTRFMEGVPSKLVMVEVQ